MGKEKVDKIPHYQLLINNTNAKYLCGTVHIVQYNWEPESSTKLIKMWIKHFSHNKNTSKCSKSFRAIIIIIHQIK